MTAKKIDFKVVREAKARLDELAREHPELIDKSIPELERLEQWEETLKGLDMAEKVGISIEDLQKKNAFNIKEAAALMSCHADTVRRAIRAGKLKAAKIGTDYRISRADLQEYWQSLGGGELFLKR